MTLIIMKKFYFWCQVQLEVTRQEALEKAQLLQEAGLAIETLGQF